MYHTCERKKSVLDFISYRIYSRVPQSLTRLTNICLLSASSLPGSSGPGTY